MSELPKADWYPDPSGQPGLRWWDGVQWTEHTHLPQVQAQQVVHQQTALQQDPALPQSNPARKPKKLSLLVTAGVAALALVVTAAIAIPTMIGGGGSEPAVEASREPVILNGYKYMPPVILDLEKNVNATFPANLSFADLKNKLTAEGVAGPAFTMGTFELFADRELSLPVHPFVHDTGRPTNGQYEWTVAPSQVPHEINFARDLSLDGVGRESGKWREIFDENVPWSQYSEYWVKRNYDADGNKLEVPEITQVIPQAPEARPEPIEVSFSKGKNDGALKLHWNAPDYADETTEYLLLKSYLGPLSDSEEDPWVTSLIAATHDTEYDSSEIGATRNLQNAGLSLFSGQSADELEFGYDDMPYDFNATDSRFGVVAIHKGQYSPVHFVAPDTSVRAQPYAISNFQVSRTRDKYQDYDVGDLSELLTWMPVTTLDGSTRSLQVQLDPESLTTDVTIDDTDENGNKFQPEGVRVTGNIIGTDLTTMYASQVPAGFTQAEWLEQLKTHIVAFNKRSLNEQIKTGGVMLTVSDSDHSIDYAEYREYEAATQTPKTDFPVFGTHPMVEHIAANMLVGEKSIDVSQWANAPGAPERDAAVNEALRQNPLLNLGRPIIAYDGNKIYIDYIFDQKTREDAMSISYNKAKEVAASVEGMSDTEKVTAINQWVIENTEYDYASLAAYEGRDVLGTSLDTEKIAYDTEFTAWSPIGVFRDGTAVCQGYAQAFTMIAREAGLESIIVSGDVVNGGPHAWNRVKVDGDWKSLDPTWNDTESNPNQYLLINENQYTGTAERTTDPKDDWILTGNQAAFATAE